MDLKKLFKKKIMPKDKSFDSILDGIVVNGDISGASGQSIRINCDVIGSVRLEKGSNSTLVVGEKGFISKQSDSIDSTDVHADHIIVSGKIDTSIIHAYESLVITSTGVVNAHDIKYGTITIETGGIITGKLEDDRE